MIALTLGLISLIACISIGPLLMASTMSTFSTALESADDIAQVKENINAIEQMGGVSNTIAGIALLIAILCFGYCFLLWATSFVGPREEPPMQSTAQSKPPISL